MTTTVRQPDRVVESDAASASSNCSINWFLSTSASAIVLKVKACVDPGMSVSLVDAPSATTRWSYGRLYLPAVGSDGMREPTFHVHTVDRRLDEARSPERRADWLRAVPKLDPAGAGLEEERREDEEILAAHERNLDVCACDPLQVTDGCETAEPAAEHHDLRFCRCCPNHDVPRSPPSAPCRSLSFHYV